MQEAARSEKPKVAEVMTGLTRWSRMWWLDTLDDVAFMGVMASPAMLAQGLLQGDLSTNAIFYLSIIFGGKAVALVCWGAMALIERLALPPRRRLGSR